MNILGNTLHTIDNISEWTGRIVSFFVLFLIGFTVFDVVLRYAFNAPTRWASELGTFLFGGAWIIGGAYVIYHEAHVKMDVVYTRFSPRGRAILDVITAPLLFLFVGSLLWKGWGYASMSLSVLEHSASYWSPPIYPLKLMIPLGAFLILLQGLAKFVRDLATATRGKEAV